MFLGEIEQTVKDYAAERGIQYYSKFNDATGIYKCSFYKDGVVTSFLTSESELEFIDEPEAYIMWRVEAVCKLLLEASQLLHRY